MELKRDFDPLYPLSFFIFFLSHRKTAFCAVILNGCPERSTHPFGNGFALPEEETQIEVDTLIQIREAKFHVIYV